MNTELTKNEAIALCEAYDVRMVIEDLEERDLLEESNPELMRAYEKIWKISEL